LLSKLPEQWSIMCVCMQLQANNRSRTETKCGQREEIDDGSASPKRRLRGGRGRPGICESDGSGSPSSGTLASGYDNYMRMMQAAMGVAAAAGAAAAAAPPPHHHHAETVVEPGRGPRIKQHLARPGADGGEHAPPSSRQLFTFLGFVVAPGPPPPPCCSRDHPFEVRVYICALLHASTVVRVSPS
jgi:hypothetical protein